MDRLLHGDYYIFSDENRERARLSQQTVIIVPFYTYSTQQTHKDTIRIVCTKRTTRCRCRFRRTRLANYDRNVLRSFGQQTSLGLHRGSSPITRRA